MQTSPFVQKLPAILADMKKDREEDAQAQQQQRAQDDSEPELVLHRYHVEGGGVVLSSVPLEEEAPPPLVDSKQPQSDTRFTSRKAPPFFGVVLLIFCLFLLLDSADSELTALFMPTATITIVPKSQTITLHSSLQLGKLLAPITVSQSLTVPTTGRGHQDAARAIGRLTFYNSAFTSQTIAAGTVFTGGDGIEVVTDAAVTIAADNPPNNGVATVSAYAVNPGSNGNIQALDVNGTVSSSLYVKNLAPFMYGQDSRDFQVVTKADIANVSTTLEAKVTASMTAALRSQLMPGEALQETPCSPYVTADHQAGDEATSVIVRVSESCTAIAYDVNILQVKAMQLLTAQAKRTLGAGYNPYGSISVTVIRATPNQQTVVLSISSQGTWLYHINEASIEALIRDKPRLTALRILTHMPGIHRASISGIPDNQLLPYDSQHIRIVIFSFLSS